MKNILKGFTFWTIVIGLILGASAIANILAEMITMEIIMKIVYIVLGFSLINLLKN